MSGGATNGQFVKLSSKDSSYDSSSVRILLNEGNDKISKHRKCAIGLGVTLICFVIVSCAVLVAEKQCKPLVLVQSNDNIGGRNSSPSQKASQNATIYKKGKFIN